MIILILGHLLGVASCSSFFGPVVVELVDEGGTLWIDSELRRHDWGSVFICLSDLIFLQRELNQINPCPPGKFLTFRITNTWCKVCCSEQYSFWIRSITKATVDMVAGWFGSILELDEDLV